MLCCVVHESDMPMKEANSCVCNWWQASILHGHAQYCSIWGLFFFFIWMVFFTEFCWPFFIHVADVERKRCKILTKRLTARCLPSVSFRLWFACLLLACNYGIWRHSLRERSYSKFITWVLFLTYLFPVAGLFPCIQMYD